MKYLVSLIRFTLLLALTLVLHSLTPWLSEQTRTPPALWRLATTIMIGSTVVFCWMHVILLRAAPPEGELLLSAPSKRELLWRLADEPAVEHQGWPWRLKTVGAWTGYGAGIATAAASTWFGNRYEPPYFSLLTTLGAATLVVSVVLILTRLAFERWAKNHPEAVERTLSTAQAQALLERAQSG